MNATSPDDVTGEPSGTRSALARLGPLCLALVTLFVLGRVGEHRFLFREEAQALNPRSIEALARGPVLAVQRHDADAPLARWFHGAVLDVAGPEPAAHHRAGVLLHALTALLLLLALDRGVTRGAPAWWAAAGFALHPLAVEPVAWISMHGRVLAGVFCALALLLRGRGSGAPAATVGLWLATLLALASHPLALALPLLIVLLDRADGRVRLGRVLPFTLLSGLALTLAWRAAVAVELPFLSRLLHAPLALAGQLGRTLLPDRLAFSYEHPALHGGGGAPAVAAWAGLIALAGLVVHLRRARPGSRTGALVTLGLTWFVVAAAAGALLPYGDALGPDRDAYLALPGLFLALGAAVSGLARRASNSATDGAAARPLIAIGALFVFLPLGVTARLQMETWRDTGRLVRAALVLDPDNGVAERVRGHELLRRGRLTEATEAFERALALRSGRTTDAGALLGLGIVAIRRPLLDEAEDAYLRGLEARPDHVELHERLGEVLQRRGDQASLVRARDHFEAATAADPTYVRAWTRQAVVEATLGLVDQARASAASALALDLEAREAWLARGMAAEQEGDPDGAIELYRRALASERDYAEPLTNIGRLLLDRGDVEGALVFLERAYFLHPLYYDALFQLARAHELLGHADEARLFYERTLAQSKRHMRARVALGRLDLEAGDLSAAQEHARQALRRNASHAGARELAARVALARGDWSEAAGELRTLLEQGAPRPDLAALLIRILAAAPDDDVRNGAEALRLGNYWARLTERGDVDVLAALAAAQAENGDFEGALATLRAAIPELQRDRRGSLDRELALYVDGKPLRLRTAGEARDG